MRTYYTTINGHGVRLLGKYVRDVKVIGEMCTGVIIIHPFKFPDPYDGRLVAWNKTEQEVQFEDDETAILWVMLQ